MLTVTQATETRPVPRAQRVMANRLISLDTRVAEADGPAAKIVVVLNGLRGLLRHVPASSAESAAEQVVTVGRNVYIQLITERFGTANLERTA